MKYQLTIAVLIAILGLTTVKVSLSKNEMTINLGYLC